MHLYMMNVTLSFGQLIATWLHIYEAKYIVLHSILIGWLTKRLVTRS